MCGRGHQLVVFTDTAVTKISGAISRLAFTNEVRWESNA